MITALIFLVKPDLPTFSDFSRFLRKINILHQKSASETPVT